MKISRQAYADMFGPTVGDKVRLADTNLWIEVEKDFTSYGEEVKFGGGKVIRDGMGQGQLCAKDVVDTLITNALIIDHWGIVKADVGLKDGRIHAIGKRLGLDVDGILGRQFVRLSGGMKQKLLIAIALGRDARLLIMDEPAANLDPEARKIFFDLLAERLADATMIISSHRLDEVSSLVNRVIEMDLGKVVIDDKVADDATLTDRLACRIAN